MKLSQMSAKLTGGKVKVLGLMGGLALAGAVMTVAAPKAEAQVAFGVRIGGPRYYAPVPAPVYGGYGYAAPTYEYAAPAYPAYGYAAPAYRWDRRHDGEWREHEEWEHRDRDRDRRYGHDGDWRR